MTRKFKKARRQFLKQSLIGVGTLSALAGSGGLIYKVIAGEERRRHFINIHARGGWDSHWFFETFRAEDASGLTNLRSEVDGNGDHLRWHHDHYTRRFTDEGFMNHPNYDPQNVVMGLGMKALFDNPMGNNLLRDDILLWRGMHYDGSHDIGNRIILHGGLSEYALSYSALIAVELARDRHRILHYVQLTENPENFLSNWALNKGAGVPINIGSYPAFQGLRLNSSDFIEPAEQSILQSIHTAVQNLSGEMTTSQFKRKSTKELFRTFLRNFNGSIQLGNEQLSERLDFKYLWKEYFLKATEAILNLYNDSRFTALSNPDASEETGNPWFDLNAVPAQTQLNEAMENISELPPLPADWKTADDSSIVDFLQTGVNNAWFNRVLEYSFNFALADFLVRNDFSAVVDVPAFSYDSHDRSDYALVLNMLIFSLYRNLLENLKTTEVPGTGKSMLDITTVAMFSEFGRTANAYKEGNEDRRGTDHARATNLLLAGYGVQGGQVVGDLMRGPGFELYLPVQW